MIRIFCLYFFVGFYSVCLDAQFVELSNRNFYFQNNIFVPLVMNYAINIRHEDKGGYWISRSMSYYTTPVGINCRDEKECLEHLIQDFTLIKEQGFNVLRIVDFEFGIKNEDLANGIPGTLDISYYYGPLKYHEFIEPFEDHFEVLDKLIQAAKQVNLKIILVSGGKQVDQFPLDEDYNIYLKYLSRRYKDEPTIMAFDLLNEPSFFHKGHTKLEARMIVRKWTSTIREQTSNQLITIGLADSHTSFDWDPILLDVDFYSFHIYPGKNGDIDNYLNQIYWISKISNKPWIIGETGYAASELNSGKYIDGNLDGQTLFFQKSYQFCLDCGAQGYSWWQFHDVAWSPDYGMLDSFNQIKPFAQIAKNLLNYKADYFKCKAPSSYFNIPEKFNDSYSGKIMNEMSEPIPNAIIICSTLSGKTNYSYSKEDGTFSVYSTSPISSIKVTAPGYKTRKRNLFFANSKIKLKKEILNESEFLLKSQNADMEYCKICVERKLEKEIIQCKNDKKCISQCTNTYKVEMDKCKNKMLKPKT